MSQAALQAMTSQIADALVGAGLADAGIYTAPGGSPIDCRVIITRAQQPFGQFGTVAGNAILLTLLLSEIAQPVRDAVIVADGQTFTLVKMSKQDDATSEWEVK